jgi:hypothetical protein
MTFMREKFFLRYNHFNRGLDLNPTNGTLIDLIFRFNGNHFIIAINAHKHMTTGKKQTISGTRKTNLTIINII